MPRRKKFTDPTAPALRNSNAVSAVLMCEGRSLAWGANSHEEPHEAFGKYPACWKCGGDLGCKRRGVIRCTGIAREVLCMGDHGAPGPVWGTKAALLEHGPLRGQKLNDYPPDWTRDYESEVPPRPINEAQFIKSLTTAVTK